MAGRTRAARRGAHGAKSMIVASALGDLGQRGRRIYVNGWRGERMIERRIAYRKAAAARAAAEVTRRAALTPEQRAAEDKIKAEQQAAWRFKQAIITELHAGKRAKHDIIANKITTPAARALQEATLARDWDKLFALTGGPNSWQARRGGGIPSLAKYSFTENGVRRYKAFTKEDIRRFVFSKHFRIEPGHICTDAQRQDRLNAHWGKTAKVMRRHPNTTWLHMWHGLYPGWGFPGERKARYMCSRYRPSRWVRIRKKVYIAAGIVTAVFLGPAVIAKVGSMLSQGSAGGAIVGAGAKAGAATAITTKAGLTTLVAAKAGTAAAVAAKAGFAAKAAGYFATVQRGIGYVNNARTVNAIIQGDMPPPPIATGKNFTDWAMNIAKDEIAKTQAEKLSELEETRMRAELAAIQREIDAFVPRGTPIAPDPNLSPDVRARIVEMQNIERTREGTNVGAIALALAVPVGLMLMAG